MMIFILIIKDISHIAFGTGFYYIKDRPVRFFGCKHKPTVIKQCRGISAQLVCEKFINTVMTTRCDAYQALETQQNMLEPEDDDVDGRRKSSSKLSKGQQRGRKPAKAAESKKRKRGDQEVDFAQI